MQIDFSKYRNMNPREKFNELFKKKILKVLNEKIQLEKSVIGFL